MNCYSSKLMELSEFSMLRIINETKATVVAQDVRLADGVWARFWPYGPQGSS